MEAALILLIGLVFSLVKIFVFSNVLSFSLLICSSIKPSVTLSSASIKVIQFPFASLIP